MTFANRSLEEYERHVERLSDNEGHFAFLLNFFASTSFAQSQNLLNFVILIIAAAALAPYLKLNPRVSQIIKRDFFFFLQIYNHNVELFILTGS